MWVTKLMISQVKKRIFCPKTTKFGPKLAFLVNLGQAIQAYSVPCWWVGWWLRRAGCISQETYLLYLMLYDHLKNLYIFNMLGSQPKLAPRVGVCLAGGQRVLSPDRLLHCQQSYQSLLSSCAQFEINFSLQYLCTILKLNLFENTKYKPLLPSTASHDK